jgi:hypothetical protein
LIGFAIRSPTKTVRSQGARIAGQKNFDAKKKEADGKPFSLLNEAPAGHSAAPRKFSKIKRTGRRRRGG